MRRYAISAFLVGSVFILGTSANLLAKSDNTDKGAYTEKNKEFYLTEDQIAFIRPGLELEILEVIIPADLQPTVRFKLTDPAGLPLDRDGVTTPGPVSTSFILSFIPEGEEAYVAYTTRVQTSPITGESAEQGSTDSGGSYETVATGEYIYKFATVLPDDYDTNTTHTLGIYARRDLREFDLDRYVTNELEHFIPSGNGLAVPRDIVTTETCNGRCHDPLALHGGSRQEVGLCILCHNPTQGIDPDTGSSVYFPVMIHKIHQGVDLANGYQVIGFRQTLHDYSEAVFPAETNDCEICHTGGTPTLNFPLVATPNPAPVCDSSRLGVTELTWDYPDIMDIRVGASDGALFASAKGSGSKATGKWVKDGTEFYMINRATGKTIQKLPVNTTVLGCMNNPAGTFRGAPGTQHTNWLDHASRQTCGSCHDDVDFATGEGHAGGIQRDDDVCNVCHSSDSGVEFDRSIRGAHKPTYKSAQLPGILVEILDVTDTNPGDTPTVTFSMNSKSGKLNPGSMDFFRLSIAGPNEDFSFFAQEDARTAVQAGDYWSYTFTTPLPADAAGSFSAGAEVFKMITVQPEDKVAPVRHTAENYTFAFAVTDPVAVPRRMVVDDAKCESCHSNLALHGTIRHNPQYCVTCHAPERGDLAVPAESIHFKWMIHKIHRGAELENGYVVVRSRGTFDFSDVEFPGDLRNCETCHVNDSYKLPLPDDLLPTTTGKALWEPMQATAAACLSCHDGDDAASHAFANTTVFGESCATCHGEGKNFAVEKVHAR